MPTKSDENNAAAVSLRFWGVRGSIPSPGPETVEYGGNTSCVELRLGHEMLVLDAGSGIRRLGLALAQELGETSVNSTVLISHTHWDRIQGLPFFRPAYHPASRSTFSVLREPGRNCAQRSATKWIQSNFPCR